MIPSASEKKKTAHEVAREKWNLPESSVVSRNPEENTAAIIARSCSGKIAFRANQVRSAEKKKSAVKVNCSSRRSFIDSAQKIISGNQWIGGAYGRSLARIGEVVSRWHLRHNFLTGAQWGDYSTAGSLEIISSFKNNGATASLYPYSEQKRWQTLANVYRSRKSDKRVVVFCFFSTLRNNALKKKTFPSEIINFTPERD